MKQSIVCFLVLFFSIHAIAQMPGGFSRAGGAGRGGNMNIGQFYGKIVDSKTNKGIGGISIQLTGSKFDTVTKQLKQAILKTVITADNGDFALEGLSLMGNFKMKLSGIGYKTMEKPVNFGIKMPAPGTTPDFTAIAAMADKDLGNIKMEQDAAQLDAVTVTSSAKPLFELGVDRKIFNVDKNLNSTGQTATEIMRNIPSISVDIDGNVTLRNATPTLFIDGRPTTLTLDQIPADIIDKVEVITNPSAKFDASGGNAGILNIVLKKNRKNGYNGGIRAGVDSRGRINGGGDISIRQNKINFFASGLYNQRRSISGSITDRFGLRNPKLDALTKDSSTNDGYFAFLRGGFDWFVDNRNTISFTANITQGKFENISEQKLDTNTNNVRSSYTDRNSIANTTFNNFGGQLSFKHNFQKNGHNITGDINYNSTKTSSLSNIISQTYTPSLIPKFSPFNQRGIGDGNTGFFTAQIDYENPLTDNTKFEAGVRAAVRDFKTINEQFFLNNSTNIFIKSNAISNRYRFTDNVYAAYGTYSIKNKKWNYQFGLRVESSNYKGFLLNNAGGDSTSFKVDFPLSFFPSTFITYKLSDKQDLQFNYSRRINRPNFFQLLPIYDFNDPLNPSVGNPGLTPEFTNSFEASYNYNYKKGSNFLVNIFYKQTDNLITRFTFQDKNLNPQISSLDSLYYLTYVNANSSRNFGIELTNRLQVNKWWDFTANVNIFYSQINVNVPNQVAISNGLTSWFAKLNNTIKLGKGFTIQLSGDYYAKTVLPQDGGGGGRRGSFGGGGFFGGGVQAIAQGFVLPRYAIDASIRKDWTWKKGRTGSLTLSMNDIFRTQVYATTAILPNEFDQETLRRRDPQILRINFSYRFGKFDMSIFKRKNTKADQGGGMDMMGGGS
jgi:outer membrane receptor protein involved in Fe transport